MEQTNAAFEGLSIQSTSQEVRAAGVQHAKSLINSGFSPVRAFHIMCEAVNKESLKLGIKVPQIDLTIGNIDLDNHPITEANFTYLNEALGIAPGTEVYNEISARRRSLETQIPRGYRPAEGLLETRKALTEQILPWGLSVDVYESIFTAGATPGLLMAIIAARRFSEKLGQKFHPIFPFPGFTPTLLQLMNIAGEANVRTFLGSGNDFNITANDIEEVSSDILPTLLVLTPLTNPTGTILDTNLIEESVMKFIEINENGIIILDWAYLMLSSPEDVSSLVGFFNTPNIRKRCIHIVSFSKFWVDPGIRASIGYAPKDSITAEDRTLNDFFRAALSTVQPTPPRATEIEALARAKVVPIEHYKRFSELIRLRRDRLFEILYESSLFTEIIQPQGALYVFGKLDATKSQDAFDLYIKTGIATVDALGFGAPPGWVRASVGETTIEKMNSINFE
ncbi:aminotransferase class I/II-fold pyridoxal phosphate-dependent enzyme [Patescibacteria group bacterium]